MMHIRKTLFLTFLHVDFSILISAVQSMMIKWHSGGGYIKDLRLTLTSVERGADSLDSEIQLN